MGVLVSVSLSVVCGLMTLLVHFLVLLSTNTLNNPLFLTLFSVYGNLRFLRRWKLSFGLWLWISLTNMITYRLEDPIKFFPLTFVMCYKKWRNGD